MAFDLSALEAPADVPAAAPSPVPMRAPLSRFEEDLDNPRTEFDKPDDPDFADFVRDIAEHGILQPLVVRVVGDKLRIRFGARRFRAASVLQLADIPYVVTEDSRQFDDYAQVAENERRRPLQPMELAAFIHKKILAGEKKKDIAAKLKLQTSTLTRLLALVDPPAFILELYDSRKCRTTEYLYDLRRLHDKNPEIVERRCAQADDIDRRLITAIAEEVEPSKPPPASDGGTVQDVLGNQAGGDGGQGGDGQRGERPYDPPPQNIPAHNPGIEDGTTPKPTDPTRLKKPLLLAKYQDREVMVVLNKRPTTAGLVHIKFEDGSGEDEVTIGDLTLTLLTESAA